ncbi:hypothetical protein Lser_V15G38842 [Lactuca serriola]
MASSGKFDLSTVSPDRPLYNSAQRGSYTSASLDRSSSFRDNNNNNMENPILSSLPSMSRSTSTVTQLDVTNFLQCLRFDPKSMAVDHKFNRHGDFRRLASAVLGSPDESPSSKTKLPNSSPDDLKRLKAGLRESTIKSRERVKAFSETLSVINKFFPSIPSRKRSRGPDGLPGDRSTGLLLNRAPMGTPKMGAHTQTHSLSNSFDFDQQKVEERGKNVIPNKRTRTSMEVRPNTPARSSGNVDRDKEPLRLPTSNEDRASLPIVADGWEKSKMKKKRTGIKVDASPSPSSGSTKPIDGYREPKQGMHPRHVPDGITRLNDSHGFRPGAANGVAGGGKAEVMRPSIPRPEIENTSLLQRDRSTSSEKERTKRSNVREEFASGSPTSSTKLHTNARGPRSGSNVVPKSSVSMGQRATNNDWELTHGTVTNKNPGQFGSGNRKRTPATRSSSPPVTQWAERRPQKMSRTARRTNLLPILPTNNNDETPGLDTSDVTGGSPSGPSGFSKRFASSPQQFKSKGDHFASSTLSESEESGAAEIRSRDKGKKCDEEGKGEQNIHNKMSTLVLPTRKNKIVNGEDIGDGVRRQGRTGGRGFGSVRAGAPHAVDKIRNVGTAKQLRTARVGFDKSESRTGRPPTRKLSDRKAYTRQKHTTAINSAADFLVGSDDGHEELLAAVNAVINPNLALSSPFWRQMEPLFGFVSDVDMLYLKQQGSIQAAVIDSGGALSNGTESRSPEHFASPGEMQIPLCQRLLAALISEEGNIDEHNYHVYGSGSGFEFETDMESNHRSTFSGHGHRINNHVMSIPDSGFDTSYNGLLSDLAMTPGSATTLSEYQYSNMSVNERLLIEIQSIGIYPELVPDLPKGNEGISAEISRLEEKHHEQVSRKKSLLDNLMEFTNETRELQEKEFERHCLEKLTAMAYQKYMSCWGPHGPGGKGVGSKMAKQAALGFVRRTLDRCHEFETTGKSCFNEPLYKEMFHNRSSHLNDTQIDNEFDKIYASGVQVQSPSLNNNNHNHDIYSSDTFHLPDQTIGKDDVWSSRVKKRELYLDDVVAGTSSSSGIPSGFGATILNSAKGKRSERDREGKGSGVISRNGPPKIGRPASVKGERKTKTKLKQKTTASLNGPVGRTNLPSAVVKLENSIIVKEKEEYCEEPLDFSHLPLPEMDVLGVGDDLGEQGQDIGSWLNIDDDILQDDDFLGLEIPMDDLSDLNMMV